MTSSKVIEYENLRTNYSYGNLALDNFWEIEEEEEPKVAPVRAKRTKKRKNSLSEFIQWAKTPLVKDAVQEQPRSMPVQKQNLIKRFIFGGSALVAVTYFICVFIAHHTALVRSELVLLQHQENALLKEIGEISIDVEQLKGPERIRDIATKQLHMMVARDNVYVRAAKKRTIADIYASGVGGQDVLGGVVYAQER